MRRTVFVFNQIVEEMAVEDQLSRVFAALADPTLSLIHI